MKRSIIYITLVLSVIFGSVVSFFPSTALAAVSTNSTTIKQKATDSCGESIFKTTKLSSADLNYDGMKGCIYGFTAAYSSSATGNSVEASACSETALANKFNGNPSAADPRLTSGCQTGVALGKQVRNTDEASSGSSGSSTNNTSDSTIISNAKSDSACQTGATEEKNGCIAGYIAGYKGISESTACAAGYSVDGYKVTLDNVSNCKSGYADGSSGAQSDNPPPSDTNTNSGSTSGGGAVNSTDSCQDGFSLAWILCSVISGTANLITGLYKDIINPILGQPQSTTLLDTSKPYYNVWSNFRIYGDIILVIALLVVVFGESIGGGLIDAYTAKKMLPRILVAAILINLSIYLVAIAVDITNVVGSGIYNLFVLPFHSAKLSGFKLHLNVTGSLFSMLAAGTGAVWVATIGGGFLHFLFVTVLGSAALVLFATMITLVLRVALILGLLFVSPVAFALYCLPNTEQYFRKWWDLLFRALLVYPIVGAIFALANITALTLTNLPLTGAAAGFADTLGLFGLFAPLIMVPFAFRMAGGAIGAIQQGVNSRMVAPGLRGIAGVRSRRRQVLHERRMGGEGRLGSGAAGTLYRGAATLGTREGWTPTRRGRSRFAAYNQKAMGQLADKKLEEAGPRAFSNDDVSAVLSRGLAGDAAISELTKMENPITKKNYTEQEARDAISRAEVATGLTAGSDAMQIAAQKYRTAMSPTAYKGDIAGTEDHRDDLMRLVDRGLITQEDAASWMKSNRSRSDYSGGSWGGTNEFLRGKKGDGSAAIHLQDAFAGADPREMLANHQFGVDAMAEQAKIRMQTAIASGDDIQIQKAIADVANIHNQLSATSPRKADAFADEVFSQGSGLSSSLPGATGTQLTVRELAQEAREHPELYPDFHDRSREYSSGAAAAGAGAIGGGGAPGAGTPGGAPGGAPGAGTPPSDKRLKTDIIFIETLSNGINLYSFKYVWGGPMYVGVMAQELLQSHPEAISKGPDGYYRVNYGMLGLEMMRLEEYLERETVYI